MRFLIPDKLRQMPFTSLTFDLGPRDPDTAEAACFDAGALSVTLTDSQDDAILEPAPGEVRLWPATRIQALFPVEAESASLVATLATYLALPPTDIEIRNVEDRAWEREWLRDFHALRFGQRLWVCPHHETVPDPQAIVVQLDPGLAFGTGTHPTTALCLEWLDGQLTPGTRVIDYGCGSGILAIAAVKLGAHAASCFDIDPQALIATHDNGIANDVRDRLMICHSADQLPTQADVVLANILAGPLCELAPRLAPLVRTGGHVVLSGLMQHQTHEVMETYSAWFDMRCSGVRDDWVCLAGSRQADGTTS